MKKKLQLFLIEGILFSSISCKKSGTDTTRISVVEYGTNKPVAHALLQCYKRETDCGSWFCGLYLARTIETDENGMADVTNANEITHVKAPGYFDLIGAYVVGPAFKLDQIGKINLHFIRTNNYAGDNILSFKISGEQFPQFIPIPGVDNNPNPYGVLNNAFYVNADTVVNNVAVGGQINTISWYVTDSQGFTTSTGGNLQIDVPVTGIAELEIKY